MAERLLVAAGGGAGLRLKRGEQLRIIDIEGGQTGDLPCMLRGTIEIPWGPQVARNRRADAGRGTVSAR